MLLVVITPTCGIFANTYSMIGIAVATIPDGIVKGPVRVLPRKPVVKAGGLAAVVEFAADSTCSPGKPPSAARLAARD
jgi:hypothetical protein